MTENAIISDLTWRSIERQKSAFAGMAFFHAPEDLPQLFRSTTRKGIVSVHVQSLGVIADNEKSFRAFLTMAKKRGCYLHAHEDEQIFQFNGRNVDIEHIVDEWRKSRRAGASQAGGKTSAKNREAESKIKCDKIRGRWPLPNKEYTTPELLAEVDLVYNTAIKYLGKRPIAQYNYQAKLKRKERANAKRNN